MTFPGQAPGKWLWRFHGGPWDGHVAEGGGIPGRIQADDETSGLYVRGTISKLDPEEDLRGMGVARGAEYTWQANSPKPV